MRSTEVGPDRARSRKLAGRVTFAALFLVAGVGHFAATDSFAKIMPPYLPLHRELVWLSGAIEVGLGVLLLVPGASRPAAWGLVALLIAVFPANIHAFQHQELFPTFPGSSTLHLLRLPLQGLLISWAFAYTTKEPAR